MDILVAHYPTYCSKWNPIEHKLFPYLHSVAGCRFSQHGTCQGTRFGNFYQNRFKC